MGYRIYLGAISNKKLKIIKNVQSKKELSRIIKSVPTEIFDENDCHCGPYDIVDKPYEYLHEFGKYIDWTCELREQFSKPIFLNKEFNKEYTNDNEIFIINKDGLKYIIDLLADDVTIYYSKLEILFKLYKIINKKCASDEEIEEFGKLVTTLKTNKDYYTDLCFTSYKELKDNDKELDYFNRMVENEIENDLKYEISEYGNKRNSIRCYNMDESKKLKISNSWLKSKGIFDLVHILKCFDFKHNKLVIYGY